MSEEAAQLPVTDISPQSEVAVPAEVVVPALEQPVIFEFHDVKQVYKIHEEGKLDFWVYTVVLETSHPTYTAPRKATEVVTIHTGRRYKEFEWLREALASEFPGVIIPPLPGLALEGMLEKVDTMLGAEETQLQQEIPALVTYRMRGISLFLRWIAKSPQLAFCNLVTQFVECSHDELIKFKAQWKVEKKEKPIEGGVAGLLFTIKRSLAGVPRSLDPTLLKAKKFATEIEAEFTLLKDNLEKQWDEIVNTCERYVMDRPDRSVITDSVTESVVRVAMCVNKAVHSFSEVNEELFLTLVVDIAFYCGLCASIKEVVSYIETLAAAVDQTEQSTPKYEKLKAQLDTVTTAFRVDFERFHTNKRTVLIRICSGFAKLSSNLDPVNYDWRGRGLPLVNYIPDPPGWTEQAEPE